MSWDIIVIDVLFVVFGVSAIFHGYKRGLIGQAIWFFSAVVGLVVASRLAGDVAELLQYRIVSKPITIAVCFILLFMITIWLLYLIGAWITKALRVSAVGMVNSVAGAIFSGLLYLVSVAFMIGLALMVIPKADDYFNKTVVLKQVMRVNKAVLDKAILDKIRKRDMTHDLT